MFRSSSVPFDDGSDSPLLQPTTLFLPDDIQQSKSFGSQSGNTDSTISEHGWTSSDSEPQNIDPVFSSRPNYSSPILGTTAHERAANRIRKGHKKRAMTFAMQKADKEDTLRKQKHRELDEVLAQLKQKGFKLWDLIEYVFHPKNKNRPIQWQQFFSRETNVTQLLDWWTSSHNSRTARRTLNKWIQEYIARKISKEAQQITRSKKLQTMGRVINSQFVSSFSFPAVYSLLSKDAPFSLSAIQALATSKMANLTHTAKRKKRTKMVIVSAALACIGEYSHANNLAKRLIGMYMYASGAQRQAVAVLSTLGLSESYGNLISKNIRCVRKKRACPQSSQDSPQSPSQSPSMTGNLDSNPPLPSDTNTTRTGTLHQLSQSMRQETRTIAATGLYGTVYDNINIDLRNAEDIVGRHDSQENGTCATLFPLFQAKVEDLDVKKLQTAFLEAPALSISDIIHTKDEAKMFNSCLIHTILRIIVKHGGKGFEHFQKDVEMSQPKTNDSIEVHKSELHPMPAWPIDESSIKGNAEVIEAIERELKLKDVPEASNRARVFAGDQLTIARLRALEIMSGLKKSAETAGHEPNRLFRLSS